VAAALGLRPRRRSRGAGPAVSVSGMLRQELRLRILA
jgi:hypothetical protein